MTSTNTGEGSALEFLIAQNKRCLQEHTECNQIELPQRNFLPTRLIDVGFGPSPSVHLCELTDLPIGAQFVALSHCWGKSRPVTLTKANLASFKRGIAVRTLPKTFQDAIEVVRRFEHRYIWIDSL